MEVENLYSDIKRTKSLEALKLQSILKKFPQIPKRENVKKVTINESQDEYSKFDKDFFTSFDAKKDSPNKKSPKFFTKKFINMNIESLDNMKKFLEARYLEKRSPVKAFEILNKNQQRNSFSSIQRFIQDDLNKVRHQIAEIEEPIQNPKQSDLPKFEKKVPKELKPKIKSASLPAINPPSSTKNSKAKILVFNSDQNDISRSKSITDLRRESIGSKYRKGLYKINMSKMHDWDETPKLAISKEDEDFNFLARKTKNRIKLMPLNDAFRHSTLI